MSYTACVFRLCSDYHIRWAPDNKQDPPEEIYSHYLIWHGRPSTCIIHALSNICIDPCQGRLDRHSSWQNWPITASKLDICKMHGPGIMHAAAGVRMHECREPNDTHLSAEGPLQPETESPILDQWPTTLWHLNVTVPVSAVPLLIWLFEFQFSVNETYLSKTCQEYACFLCVPADDFIANVYFCGFFIEVLKNVANKGTVLSLCFSSYWSLLRVADCHFAAN